MHQVPRVMSIAAAIALASGCASYWDDEERQVKRDDRSVQTQARADQGGQGPDPYQRPDDSWISIDGTIISASAESFWLDYGDGKLLVEMDDWDWYDEGRLLKADDKVRVYGRIDNDLYERRSVEASAVFVEGLGSYFYANDADEEDVSYAMTVPVVVASVQVKGTVTEVGEKEFTVDTGEQKLTVETTNMAYDPLDDEGYQQIEKGDFVSVSGTMDADFFTERHLNARYVTLMTQDRTRQNEGMVQGEAQRDTQRRGEGRPGGVQQSS